MIKENVDSKQTILGVTITHLGTARLLSNKGNSSGKKAVKVSAVVIAICCTMLKMYSKCSAQ